jgi:flavin-dependent dehydrogenase
MMENHDVTVIGARWAGMQAARLLGERDYYLLLLEESPRFHCFLDPRFSQLALSDADCVSERRRL